MDALNRDVTAGDGETTVVTPRSGVVLSRPDLEPLRGKVWQGPAQELRLTKAFELCHPSSIVRRRRVADSASDASPTALTTQTRRTPTTISCAMLDSSMPPMANTGAAGPTASATPATPLGPI